VGKRRVIPAIELIAESMCIDEICEVTCTSSYTFGRAGLKRKGIPGNSTIIIKMHLVSFKASGHSEKSFAEMSAAERFAKAERFKECGNKLFKETKYEKAVAEYSSAIRLLANVFTQPMIRPENLKKEEEEEKEKELTKSEEESTEAPTTTSPTPEPGSNVDNANATVVSNTDEEGFQEAEIVIDATGTGEPLVQTPGIVANGTLEEEGALPTTTTSSEPNGVVSDGAAPEINSADNDNDKDDDEEATAGSPTEAEVVSLHVRTLNNLSLCCFKLGQHASAEEGATLAIRLDEKNFKGFYYRGRARVSMGKLDEARSDFMLAAKMKPQNMGIRTELDSVDKKLKVQKAKERKQAEAMFA